MCPNFLTDFPGRFFYKIFPTDFPGTPGLPKILWLGYLKNFCDGLPFYYLTIYHNYFYYNTYYYYINYYCNNNTKDQYRYQGFVAKDQYRYLANSTGAEICILKHKKEVHDLGSYGLRVTQRCRSDRRAFAFVDSNRSFYFYAACDLLRDQSPRHQTLRGICRNVQGVLRRSGRTEADEDVSAERRE